jgi:hypothetical protein
VEEWGRGMTKGWHFIIPSTTKHVAAKLASTLYASESFTTIT